MKNSRPGRSLLRVLGAAVLVAGVAGAAAAGPRFKLLWHVGPQIEELADLPSDARPIVERTRKLVDGFYFLFIERGILGYWPQRPSRCSLNFHQIELNHLRISLDGETVDSSRAVSVERDCRESSEKAAESSAALRRERAGAADRVLTNLGLGDSRSAEPAIIVSEMLLDNRHFALASAGQSVKLTQLPRTLGHLVERHIEIDYAMAYQEPGLQTAHGTSLYPCPSPSCRLTLTESAVSGLREAFLRYRAPDGQSVAPKPFAGRFIVNIRRWSAEHERAYSGPKRSGLPDGVLFEGGVWTMDHPLAGQTSNVATFADGAVWLLRNTDLKVFLMMPAHLPPGASERQYAEDLGRYLRELNDRMRKLSGAANQVNPVCNERIHFIPAGYGVQTHLRQFASAGPARSVSEPSQGREGSVTGELVALATLRDQLCGAGSDHSTVN
ncbi:MAG: hypothetical protein U1E83_05595 [Methylotetracoccus sp.]